MKKFEFILYINGNIVVQRFFTVKNFNPQSLKSYDIKECIDECVRIIQNDMKEKTMDYLEKNYNPWSKQTLEDIIREDIYENEDVFDFEINVEEKFLIKKRFTGNVYPQRVRYSVDIRKLIPSLIKEIQDTFSQKNFNVEYCGITL